MPESENLALARRFAEAWNANDWEAMEAMWDPDGELVAPDDWPESGSFRGWPAIARQTERLKEAWRDERLDIVDIAEYGERLLIHVRWRGHGEVSGIDLDLQAWPVVTIRDGRIVRSHYFLDSEAARRAMEETAA